MNQHTTAPGVLVRGRRDSDLAAAAEGLGVVHVTDGYPMEKVGDPVGWLSPPGMVGAWVAELEGRVVGHVAVTRGGTHEVAVRMWVEQSGADPGEVDVLARLFVVPEGRGHAAGAALVAAATADARARGMRLVLDVLSKDAAAIRLYRHLGWTELGSVVHEFASGPVNALCFVSPEGP
ncbi:GNAT family N-acetyltransferase [Streptomyces sp. NPDC004031]